MSSWLLTLFLTAAQAAEPDTAPRIIPAQLAPDEAAATLSRYPAGLLPATEPVMAAIEVLGSSGEPAHRAVLESLKDLEKPPVAYAAAEALSALDRRERRDAYTAPDSRQIRRWIGEQDPLKRADGSTMGRHEQDALAYAALVLGEPRSERIEEPRLLHIAEEREDAADISGALTLYARAASLGEASALETIRTFGVDPELLLLGMSVSSSEALVETAPPQALDVLIREGSSSTVAVLIERADSANHIDQAVALDALAEMLRTTALPASARRSARSELEKAAASSREEALSAFARAAIDDLEW